MSDSGNGMGSQIGQIAKFESQHVRGLKYDLWCDTSFKSLLPA
jgi:hypothetical protein